MRPPKHPSRWLAVLLAVPFLLASHAFAQQAGEVEFSRGVGFAQSPGQAPRTLGKGLPLQEGDRLTTADGASAIIRLQDGTRMTVRPNSELVLQQYQFKENAPDNGMLMQLVRGGFRAVTGLISKSSPNAARVQTSTATIGIRGTDFDARLCRRDCAAESAEIQEKSRPNLPQASARIVTSQGEVFAVDPAGQRRRLADGGSVYPGDTVETGRATHAVMAFRDDSRITLGASTQFRVDNFVFDEKNAGEGRFLMSLLRGSARALTGLIAKANTRNVRFSTPTATIGIRGTDLSMCTNCRPEGGLSLWTWLGAIEVAHSGQSALQVLAAGNGLFITPSGISQVINTPPVTNGPAPGQVNVPPNLFSHQEVTDNEEGLFVFVRDGHIQVVAGGQVLDLGRNEAGFAGSNGQTGRPSQIPRFLEFDRIPMPNTRNPLAVSVLGQAGFASQCR